MKPKTWTGTRLCRTPLGTTEIELLRHDGHVESLGTIENALARREAFEAMRGSLRRILESDGKDGWPEGCAALALADKVKP